MRFYTKLIWFAATIAAVQCAWAGGNGWSGVVAISGTLNPDPTRDSQLNDVAVNASGLAVAAWDQYWYSGNGGSSVGVAVQLPGSKWGAPTTVSSTNGFALHPKVAAGADGTLAVIWTFETPVVNPPAYRSVQVAVRAANATAWSLTTLATAPLSGVAMNNPPVVGIDAQGNVTAAWTLYNGTSYVAQAATLPKGGAWSVPVTLSTAGSGFTPSLSVNARGDAGLAVSVSPYLGYYMPSHIEYFARAGANGTWSGPVSFPAPVPASSGYIMNPVVALDANGLATVIYMGNGVEATRQTSISGWTTPVSVIPPINSVSSYLSPDLAADASGNSVIAVSIFDATINVDRASVWVARGTALGGWSQAQRITDPTIPVDAYATRAAMSPDGTLAMVGWIDHYHGNVQVSQWKTNAWGAATTIGKSATPSSFQEVLSLDVSSGTIGRAIWKTAKGGIVINAASYGK